MPKYAFVFTYSGGSWARMINSPGDRNTAAARALESLGGSLDSLYWAFESVGNHDGLAIVDLPDSVTAAALATAINKTGAFKSIETHQLRTLTWMCRPPSGRA
jgi:uncharacterized protein with GYD domain